MMLELAERGPGPQYNSILSRVYLISSSLIQAKFVADQVKNIGSNNFWQVHVWLPWKGFVLFAFVLNVKC